MSVAEPLPGPPSRRATVVVVAAHRPAALRRVLAGARHPLLEAVVVNVGDDPAVRRAAGPARVVPAAEDDPGAALSGVLATAAGPVAIVLRDDELLAPSTALGLADALTPGTVVALPPAEPAADAPTPEPVLRRGAPRRGPSDRRRP